MLGECHDVRTQEFCIVGAIVASTDGLSAAIPPFDCNAAIYNILVL